MECPLGPTGYKKGTQEGWVSSDSNSEATVELVLFYNGYTGKNMATTTAHPPPAGSGFTRPPGPYPGFTYGAFVLPLSAGALPGTSLLSIWAKGTGPHIEFWTLSSASSAAAANASGFTLWAEGIARIRVGDAAPPPPPGISTRLVTAARAADVVVVCIATGSGEGSDRTTLAFDDATNAMVSVAANANPRIVVVMHNPAAVLMPWIHAVAAVLAAFYPGQEMGNSLAAILFGDVSPSGRLPVTFPASDRQKPLGTLLQYPGLNLTTIGHVNYTEGLMVGYRWWESGS